MLGVRECLWFEDPDDLVRACRAQPELAAAFGSEERCREWLARMRWPGGFRCPKCGGEGRWDSERGGYHCRRRRCRKFTSVTAGTVLHGTRKPLTKWFEALLLIVSRGVNARTLQRVIGLTYKAAWTWGHKLRALLVPFIVPEDRRPPREKWAHERFDAERVRCGPTPRRPDPAEPGPCGCTKLTKRDFRWPDEREEERAADRADLKRRLGVPESRIYPPVPPAQGSPRDGDDAAHHELLATYFGSVSERHLRVYLDELGFRANRRWRSPRESLALVAPEIARSEPRPYKAIVARPAPTGHPIAIYSSEPSRRRIFAASAPWPWLPRPRDPSVARSR
jgi:hypothetical protein